MWRTKNKLTLSGYKTCFMTLATNDQTCVCVWL